MRKTVKQFITALVLTLCLFVSACTTKTEYGDCIGIGDDRNPNLIYKIDTTNAVLGVVFFEMVLPPIYWLADDFFCPIGRKDAYKLPPSFENDALKK